MSVETKEAIADDDRTPDYSDLLDPIVMPGGDAKYADGSDAIDVEPAEEEQLEAQPEPQPQPSPVDVKRAEMIRRFQGLGVASDAEACETISKIINREVKSSDELPEEELDKVLAQLKASVKEGEQ